MFGEVGGPKPVNPDHLPVADPVEDRREELGAPPFEGSAFHDEIRLPPDEHLLIHPAIQRAFPRLVAMLAERPRVCTRKPSS
jgi:hypothetical protein